MKLIADLSRVFHQPSRGQHTEFHLLEQRYYHLNDSDLVAFEQSCKILNLFKQKNTEVRVLPPIKSA